MKKLVPKWNFNQLLKNDTVTVNQLYRQLKNEVSRNGLYKWSKSQPKSINLEHAGIVLTGLSAITGKEYLITDLVSFELQDSDDLQEKLNAEQDAYELANSEQLLKLDSYEWGDISPNELGEKLEFVDGEWESG